MTVNLVEPGTLYGDRVNEVDLRLAKILRFGRTRTNVGFDIYNILNSAPVLSYNQAFSPTTTTWLTPTARAAAAVLEVQRAGRFLRITRHDMRPNALPLLSGERATECEAGGKQAKENV